MEGNEGADPSYSVWKTDTFADMLISHKMVEHNVRFELTMFLL